MEIKICELQDAILMKEKGTFRGFLQMWSDKYPYTPKLSKVKQYKEENGCSIKEALLGVVPDKDVKVDFLMGPNYILRKDNASFSRLVRVNGIWVEVEKSISLGTLATENDLFPIFKRSMNPICSLSELRDAVRKGKLEPLAKKIASRIRGGNSKIRLFCEDEVWKTDFPPMGIRYLKGWNGKPEILHIYTKVGTKDILFTTKSIREYLEEYCTRRLLQVEM